MTNTLRNRLVGSIILAAAGIIIIPSLLDGQKASYKDDFKAIPARPEFRSVQTAKTFPDESFTDNLPTPDTTITDEVAVDIEPPEQTEQAQADDSSDDVVDRTVMETETLAVGTISKPEDFSNNPVKPRQVATKPAKTKPKPKPPTVVKKASQEKAKVSPFSASGWVIQLGSFGQKANAVALEKKLNAAGFVTFSRKIRNKNRDLTKVYVGPELDRKVLEKALSRVNTVASVKATITSFKISQ
jgi:DedD protein